MSEQSAPPWGRAGRHRSRKQNPEHGEKVSQATAQRVNLAPLYSRTKLGFWFFLGGEIILFATLISTFALSRITFAAQYPGFRSLLNVPLIGLNTFILVTSSYFVVRTLSAARQKQQTAMLVNLLIVVFLGSLFITGQAYEWSTLYGMGVTVENNFGAPFFILTGIHGTHVLVGIIWACILLVFGLRSGPRDRPDRAIEIFGLYWHFVDIVWIVLFSLIYLI
jgi:cytochrome c oxidase subunit 3/cytochrome o ubiquinol oxidase subunit 3